MSETATSEGPEYLEAVEALRALVNALANEHEVDVHDPALNNRHLYEPYRNALAVVLRALAAEVKP